jgi:hypothetical protein
MGNLPNFPRRSEFQAPFPLPLGTGGGGGAGAANPFPFQAKPKTTKTESGFTFYPGVFGVIVPTLNGKELEVKTPPIMAKAYDDITVYLKVSISFTSAKRYHVDSVIVVNDDAGLEITDENQELKMFWDGGDDGPHTVGRTYVRICDIGVNYDTGTPVWIITQYLFNSINSFAIAGDDVVIMN